MTDPLRESDLTTKASGAYAVLDSVFEIQSFGMILNWYPLSESASGRSHNVPCPIRRISVTSAFMSSYSVWSLFGLHRSFAATESRSLALSVSPFLV